MGCQVWTEKLDAYLDGELVSGDERALREHLPGCAACAADSLQRMQTKRAIQSAGLRFVPDPAFRARIQNSLPGAKPARRGWQWFPVLAAVAAVLVVGVLFATYNRDRMRERRLTSELVDLHVATLASASPVDVVSTDRHTVKPWFAGKIPFTFNLPELEGSSFVLVGGRVSYLNQSPGAELIFRVRQHQVSVFIFQERALDGMRSAETSLTDLSFGVHSWSRNGLRYFVIGDVSGDDLDKLSNLLKASA
jgi:anti-sigma factor RsiW